MSVSINTSRIKLHWDNSKKIPHSCSLCGYLLRDKEDFVSYKSHKVCTVCADTYYYPNAEAWEAGWRPNLEKKDDKL